MTHAEPSAPRRRPWRNLLIIAVLLTVIGAVIVFPPERWWSTVFPSSQCQAQSQGEAVELRAVVGSESAALLTDPQVTECLAQAGIRLQTVDPSGSLAIPTRGDLDVFDFAFPSSAPAADRLRRDRNIPASESPFFSPMVVATYQPVIDVLSRAGIVRQTGDGIATLDIAALTATVVKGTRWKDLPGNTVPGDNAVLLRTTDPADSNSAAMFVSLASYAANNNRIVSTAAEVDTVVPRICPLISRQGYKDGSSQYLFDRYLTGDIGSTPMVLVYENQFRAAQRAGQLRPGQVMLYPSPTVLSRYSPVALHENSRRLVQELSQNPGILKRAIEFGFRLSRPMPDTTPEPLPPNVVDPPRFEILTELARRVGGEC